MKNWKRILPLQTDVDVILKQSPETDGKIICWPKEKKKGKPDILFDWPPFYMKNMKSSVLHLVQQKPPVNIY